MHGVEEANVFTVCGVAFALTGQVIAAELSILDHTTPRVQVPNNWVLGIWVLVIIVQVWGKYMIIGHLDP